MMIETACYPVVKLQFHQQLYSTYSLLDRKEPIYIILRIALLPITVTANQFTQRLSYLAHNCNVRYAFPRYTHSLEEHVPQITAFLYKTCNFLRTKPIPSKYNSFGYFLML